MRSLFFFKLLFLAGLVLCDNETESQQNEFDYIFTYPQSMISGGKATACLTLRDAKLPAKLSVIFTLSKCGEDEDGTCENSYEITKDHQCFELDVPNRARKHQIYIVRDILEIEIEANGQKIRKSGPEGISIFGTEIQLLVETDRGRYKPEDIVRIRILALENDLTPVLNYTISKPTLYNPQGTKVKVWENVPTISGLAQLEYQLQDSAPTGYWRIDFDGKASAQFYVETYILPRFQTTLEYPNLVYIDDKTIDSKICAKYSYGKSVKGMGVIKVTTLDYNNHDGIPISKSEKLRNGCISLSVPLKDLGLLHYGFLITGSVTEHGTEETQTKTGSVYVSTTPYQIEFDYSNNKLRPGLPYKGTVEFKYIKVDLNRKKVNICFKYRENRNYNFITIDCQGVIVDNDKINFTIPPLKRFSKGEITLEIDVQRDDVEKALDFKLNVNLQPFYFASNNSLQIIRDNRQEPTHCGDDVTFTVFYTLNNITDDEIVFDYLFQSRYDIVKTGQVNVKPKGRLFDPSEHENVFRGENNFTQSDVLIDEFKIKLKLDDVYTRGKLVVFYMTNGEIIVDVADVNIDGCLPNKVDIKFNKDTLEPAEKASLEISTGEGSLCALTSIDKASTFESPPNAFTIDKILRSTEHRRYPYSNWIERNCVKSAKQLEEETMEQFTSTMSTTIDSSQSPSGHYVWRPAPVTDAYNIFRHHYVGVISNQELLTKPCGRQFEFYQSAFGGITGTRYLSTTATMPNQEPMESVADSGGSVLARTYFPETFLWDIIPAEQGHAVFERDLPDSITNWITNVLCVSKTKGVGLSPSLELNVFKPFFADVLMPYSIKRNAEIMHLPVAVFNYLNNTIPVRVTLGNNEDLELVDGGDKKTASICVEAGDSATHVYRIKALKLGTLNVSVSAELDPQSSKNCGNEKVVVKRDLIYKTVKVEAEGYPSNIVRSALLCGNDSLGTKYVSWEINLPEVVVNDTVVGSITINSDILGPVIENLDDWLRVPSGCGEQIMAGLVPNLYVLRYLKSNNALTKEIKSKALKNMEIGYQRILGYSHEDGSFSAFGKRDSEGSMFLTAFVVRTLRLMKEYITIQDDVIDKAVSWITQHQTSNGCFDSVSHVFQPMGADNEKDNQTTALTSYVVISLRETDLNVSDDVMSKAKECILRGDKSDNYTMAISSYALELMNLPELAEANLKTLLEAADVDDDTIFWKKKRSGWYSGAQDVEVAGYALLALLRKGTPEYIGYGSSIIRFLQTQMNPRGGYYSTQDSVVALDGMSQFASIVNEKEPNIDIEVSTKQSGKKNIEIRKRDQNSKEKIPLTAYPELINIKVKGDGCVLGQVAVKFNVNEKPNSEALKLDVSTKSTTRKNRCSLLEVKPCVSYKAKGHSNMALLEVSMPSGYVPDQASLHALKGSVPDVKKFELIENKVVLYFNRLTSDVICTPFVIQETVVVENKADPTVKLFDYYNPEVSVSQSFELPTCELDNAIEN